MENIKINNNNFNIKNPLLNNFIKCRLSKFGKIIVYEHQPIYFHLHP